jgi:hypothetical protein
MNCALRVLTYVGGAWAALWLTCWILFLLRRVRFHWRNWCGR